MQLQEYTRDVGRDRRGQARGRPRKTTEKRRALNSIGNRWIHMMDWMEIDEIGTRKFRHLSPKLKAPQKRGERFDL